jgi:hypothetical protein
LIQKTTTAREPLASGIQQQQQQYQKHRDECIKALKKEEVEIKISKNEKIFEPSAKNINRNQCYEKIQKRHSIATASHLRQYEINGSSFDELFNETALKHSHQPIQFSFTLYDVDGYGKITKDDIAGIVSTIYDSIGKTVVVPHYGKKTINVKLTVSPDASKNLQSTANLEQKSNKKHNTGLPRRKHIIISDEENGNESDTDDSTIQNNCANISKESRNLYESFKNLKCCNQTATMENLHSKNKKNLEMHKYFQLHQSLERLHNREEIILNLPQKSSTKKKTVKKQKLRKQKVQN